MLFSNLTPLLFMLASTAFALEAETDFVADLANQLNRDIVRTTQFFEAFPALSGLALATQANAAQTALQDAIGVVDTITLELSNNPTAQVLKGALVDNDFLLNVSLQLQDFAEGLSSDPFPVTLGLYCSDAIPEINTLFQIVGDFVNDGITNVALLPSNCISQ